MLKLSLSLVILLSLLSLGPIGRDGHPSQDMIRAGYERFYQGDVDGAYEYFRSLAQREPENLAAALGVLWTLERRLEFEESLQKEFEDRAEQLIHRAEARYDKNHSDGDALFNLAQAYAGRAAYRFDHDKGIWGAARDAAKSKHFSDAYLKLDPGRADAYFALGLYNYYVDIAPSFVKFFRVLLFLPSGNRGEGLKQIERAAREGQFFAPQAQSQLSQIYGRMEGRVEEALGLTQGLAKRYPENPDYQFAMASLYAHPTLENYQRAAETYQAILRRSEQDHAHFQGATRYNALMGLARVSQQRWRLDEAIAALTPTIDTGVTRPVWVLPRFLLTRGNYRSLMNDPNAAADISRVVNEAKWKTWHKGAERLSKWSEQRRQSGEAAVFAALIPGNRLVAERRWDDARQAYQRILQQYPNDAQVQYRFAYLDFARGEFGKAASTFDQIGNRSPGKVPDWLKANSLLYLARIHDLRGQRDQALKLYKLIVDDFESESAAQPARVGLITPYRQLTPSG